MTLQKRLLSILLFVALFFAGDRLLARLLEKVTLASHFRYSTIYRSGSSGSRDMLILGNSRGVNFLYAPDFQKVTGFSALNLSYNGLSTRIAEAVLLDYLEHKPKPRMVILEISNLMMDDHAIDDFKLYTLKSSRMEAIFRSERSEAYRAGQVSHLYRFNSDMFLRALYYLNRSDQTWINRRRVSPEVLKSLEEMEETELRAPLESNIEALVRIARMLREKGVVIRLVMAPYLPEYLSRVQNLAAWLDTVRKGIGDKEEILDYTAAVDDRSAFADRTHLNANGAALLLKKLVKDGFFRDLPTTNAPSAEAEGGAKRGKGSATRRPTIRFSCDDPLRPRQIQAETSPPHLRHH